MNHAGAAREYTALLGALLRARELAPEGRLSDAQESERAAALDAAWWRMTEAERAAAERWRPGGGTAC